jgi:hypothetical protein
MGTHALLVKFGDYTQAAANFLCSKQGMSIGKLEMFNAFIIKAELV